MDALADSTEGSAPASVAVAAEGPGAVAAVSLLPEATGGDSSGKRKS